MSTALILVDLQQDFLRRPGLLPSPEVFSGPLRALLAYARHSDIPVVHVRTRVHTSPDDRMPHWRARGIYACVAGTEGETAPPQFGARQDERVFYKQYFSGFGQPGLDETLRELQVTDLWIAGLYTHGCVRATAMDAYERGYRVTLVSDCVASTDPLHAQITLDYMAGRAARLASCAELTGTPSPAAAVLRQAVPVERDFATRDAFPQDIDAVATDAAAAAAYWRTVAVAERRGLLRRFAGLLAAAHDDLTAQVIREIAKPRRAVEEELRRALDQLAVSTALETDLSIEGAAEVLYEPHGAVAVITPWNNPVAIPVGKIAAALVQGNSVVWKPAPAAATVADSLLRLLLQAGMPGNLVQLVQGGASEAAALAAAGDIAAVTLTGPEEAGRALAAICLPRGKPLQAELGGNNGLLVLDDADIETLAPVWAQLAFGFAGQRCTAIRRFIVEETVLARFEQAMTAAIGALEQLPPEAQACAVGPMISASARERAAGLLAGALDRGARVVCQCDWRESPDQRPYFAPVLLAGLAADDELVQEESFAPIALLQVAQDFEQGLALVNGVRQGLLAGIATASPARRRLFARTCEAGIVMDGEQLPLHPAAPFGGRKASGIGPPEHGIWDREFFARPKAVYFAAPPC